MSPLGAVLPLFVVELHAGIKSNPPATSISNISPRNFFLRLPLAPIPISAKAGIPSQRLCNPRNLYGLADAVVVAAGPKVVMVRTAVAGVSLPTCTAFDGREVDGWVAANEQEGVAVSTGVTDR